MAVDLPTASIFLGFGPPIDGRRAEERLASLLPAVGPAMTALRMVRQVHGTDIHWLLGPQRDGVEVMGDGDGLATAQPGVGLVVWSADCVPVLLATPTAVAAVHAGWRGAAAGVVDRAVEGLAELDGGLERLDVVLGPAIAADHYQVGPEVIDALGADSVGGDDPWLLPDRRVDLRTYLAARLRALGLAAASIHRHGPCTACTPSLASYRRDGQRAGRQLSMIARAADRR